MMDMNLLDTTDKLLACAQAAVDLAQSAMNRGEYEMAAAHTNAADLYTNAARKARLQPAYTGLEAAQ